MVVIFLVRSVRVITGILELVCCLLPLSSVKSVLRSVGIIIGKIWHAESGLTEGSGLAGVSSKLSFSASFDSDVSSVFLLSPDFSHELEVTGTHFFSLNISNIHRPLKSRCSRIN